VSTPEADETGATRPVDLPAPTPPPPATPAPALTPDDSPGPAEPPPALSARAVAAPSTDGLAGPVTYVPLAVTIGDGFKFGCGFFLALVLAMLVGFVLLAALFVLSTVFGVSLPLAR
jgi:hypothetical protein